MKAWGLMRRWGRIRAVLAAREHHLLHYCMMCTAYAVPACLSIELMTVISAAVIDNGVAVTRYSIKGCHGHVPVLLEGRRHMHVTNGANLVAKKTSDNTTQKAVGQQSRTNGTHWCAALRC